MPGQMYAIAGRYKNGFQFQMKNLLLDLMFRIKLFLKGEIGVFSKMFPVVQKSIEYAFDK